MPATIRSLLLFVVAAVAGIGGAWLVWQGVREHRGVAWIGAGIIALGAYGFVATLQPDANFGRILAAYGGIFVVGSLAWGRAVDGFRPDRSGSSAAALRYYEEIGLLPEASRTPAGSRSSPALLSALLDGDRQGCWRHRG